MMMKAIFLCAIAMLVLCLIGNLSISFAPEFSVSMPRWKAVVGIVLLVGSFSFFTMQYMEDGIARGVEHTAERYHEMLSELVEEGKLTKEEALGALEKMAEKLEKED